MGQSVLAAMRIIRAVLEELELVEVGGSRGYCAGSDGISLVMSE